MRPVYDSDFNFGINHALTALMARMRKSLNPQFQLSSVEVASAYIRKAMTENRAFIHHGYLILVDVATPWHSRESVLIEELILKVYDQPEWKVEEAIACLDGIALAKGVRFIVAGDTQVGYMVPKYHAAGFVTLGTQLFKEVA